jgi:phosphomannomutase
VAFDELTTRVRKWIEGDPDPETRRELDALLEAGDLVALGERMAGPLEFGTAGIRGAVGAGPSRMNRAVIIRTTRGLADVLLERSGGRVDRPVVVGRDARLSSEPLAADTVGVLAAAGIQVLVFGSHVPTPLVAHAAKRLGAEAAVVVTASHNPPADNGYKVYDSNSAQIIPPLDQRIADAIERVGPAAEVPMLEPGEWAPPLVEPVPDDTESAYIEEVMAARISPGGRAQSIVYTPLHGVAGSLTRRALTEAGHGDIAIVPEQEMPDGRFPTVRFPNPEEPGALDLAVAMATERDADLILANDPDGDRLAVALPAGEGWRQLTGNQVGVLMAAHILQHAPREPGPPPMVLSSVVSTPLLGQIAAAHNAHWEPTLTGFKWIWNAALALQDQGRGRFVFGFEEALGYSVGQVVRDKDGISAAVVLADISTRAASSGRSLWDLLGDLAGRHGLWVSAQHAVTRSGADGPSEIGGAVDRVAAAPPQILGGMTVTDVSDLRTGGASRPPWLPDTDLVELRFGSEGRALVRPSGTEPKLKIYVDLRLDPPSGSFIEADDAGRAKAAAIGAQLAAELGL